MHSESAGLRRKTFAFARARNDFSAVELRVLAGICERKLFRRPEVEQAP